jgi:hypothetical protein
MRRAVVVVAGLALAIPAALFVLPLALLLSATVASPASWRVPSLFDLVAGLAWTGDPAGLATAALKAAARTLALVCGAPVICAALIGEAAGLASWLWYVGATAAFSLGLPLAAIQGPSDLRPMSNPEAWAPLLATGAVAGLVYWAIASPRGNRQAVWGEHRPGGA